MRQAKIIGYNYNKVISLTSDEIVILLFTILVSIRAETYPKGEKQ